MRIPYNVRKALGPAALFLWSTCWPVLLRTSDSFVSRREVDVGDNPPISAYCVFRQQNVRIVTDFIAGIPRNAKLHLHCLDGSGVPDVLAEHTRSQGPGVRVPLLQSLIDTHPPRRGDWVLIFDDDVQMRPSDVNALLHFAAAGAVDVAQPAHSPESHASHSITRSRLPVSILRLTEFVEVGPVVLLSPAGAAEVLPFPSDIRMGWGLDVAWTNLTRSSLRMGVIDVAPMQHVGAIGTGYPHGEEREILDRYLSEAGVNTITELTHATGAVWRPWQATPPWLQREPSP